MALQSSVNLYRAEAVPGDKATPEQSVYHPVNLFPDSTGVKAGTFVWINSDGDLTNTKPDSGVPVGLVERNLSAPIYSLTTGASMVIQNVAVNLAVKGDYWVKSDTQATAGQKVFAKTNGGIATGTAGGSVSGGVETSWKVVVGCAANGIMLISNWN